MLENSFQVPTRRVILKASGDVILINKDDFNEELHEAPVKKKAAAEEPAKGDGAKK